MSRPRRPLRRLLQIAACATLLVGCGKIDRVLEGPAPVSGKLSVGVQSPLSVPLGGEETVVATITRTGSTTGDIALTVEGLPEGVTASVVTQLGANQTTTATVVLRVAPGAKLGSYLLTLRGRTASLSDATTPLVLNVVEVPAVQLALSSASMAVVRGGIAPFVVGIVRTNVTAPVSLSLQGPSGISAAFDANPTAGDRVSATLMVAGDVDPGVYSATLRATATGIAEQVIPLSITVTSDPLQVLVGGGFVLSQASVTTADVVINRNGYAGPVLLQLEGLPAGATASFQPASASGNTAKTTLVVSASVPVGTSTLTLRGRGVGVPDAITPVSLTVKPAAFSLAVSPQSITVTPSSTTTVNVAVTRNGYDGALALTSEGAPSGMTVTAQPSVMTGTSAALAIVVANTVPAGNYDIVVRATPDGLPTPAAPGVTINITVRPISIGTGNVTLDWSACSPPAWVAGQDGNSAWTQLLPSGGKVQFSVTSPRGAFAFREGRTTTVRYMTLAELSERPFDMCAPPVQTKTVTGSAVHSTNPTESFLYQLGGGSATSSYAASNFTITGIREGVHDLIAYGLSFTGASYRALIRRDLDLPNGASLGLVSMFGPESFVTDAASLTVSGQQGDVINHAMSYLTTQACDVNVLYASASPVATLRGIPSVLQRETDFHLLTVTAVAGTRGRTASAVFHTLGNRTVALAPVVAAPAVVGLAGPYRRLQATIGSASTEYNGTATLKYNDNAAQISASASMGFAGNSGFVLAMPDLSGVSGWSNENTIAAGATVTWTFVLDGASPAAPLCIEGRRAVTLSHSGVQ
ncbi:MAG: hypothetical protein V4550_19590 [Gemmatimonadota bacterium]